MAENTHEHPFLIPESDLSFASSRSGGPGGQNVNKVETRVTVAWNVNRSPFITDEQRFQIKQKLNKRITTSGDLILHCSIYRSQLRNKEEVTRRLTALVRDALTEKPKRKPTKPSRHSREKRLQIKRERAGKKERRKPPHLFE